jgi:hypothetical protein
VREQVHPSDLDLITRVDGELSARRKLQVAAHLASCWYRRERMGSMESTIAEFVRARKSELNRQLDRRAPGGSGSRALLRARLAKASRTIVAKKISPRDVWELAPATRTFFGVLAVIVAIFEATATAEGSKPKAALTSGETRPVTIAEVCRKPDADVISWVPPETRHKVFSEYGIRANSSNFEVDYLITPDLGGTDTVGNLWPQPCSANWNAHVKDRLEPRTGLERIKNMRAPQPRFKLRLNTGRSPRRLLLLFLLPVSLLACKCEISYPVCNEVVANDVVFIGTVESVEPAFLDPWDPKSLSLLPTAEIMRLRAEATPESLDRLKDIFLKLYPSLTGHYKEQLQSAATHRELETVVNEIESQGKQARVRVRKYFKRADDDDDDADAGKADDDDKDNQKDDIVTVWTPSDDCGYDFQKGETYLIYADSDEETGRIETTRCTRTRRLTDAGDDLAYLYFRENGGDESTRLEGFVTDDANQDVSRFVNSIGSPVSDIVLKLQSRDKAQYTRSAADGRFVFDGLAAGQHSLTAFAAGFPREVVQVVGPTQFQVEGKSCSRQIVVTPTAKAKPLPPQ